jgi:hypothetical protein
MVYDNITCVMVIETTAFRDIVRPCIKDGLLAPTAGQRMEFAAWLRVFAKDFTWMPSRMAMLLDNYNVSTLHPHFCMYLMWSYAEHPTTTC